MKKLEYIDVLDKNSNPTNEVKTRGEVHKRGYYHLAVHIWLMNSNGELLVQLRSKNKESHPGMWDISVAGHVASGQTSLEAALREANEELGIKIEKEELKFLFRYQLKKILREDYINNGFFDVYILEKDIPESKIGVQEEEVDEVKYIRYKDLQKEINNKNPLYVNHKIEYDKLFEFLDKKFEK